MDMKEALENMKNTDCTPEHLELTKGMKCEACGGLGHVDYPFIRCNKCKGKGKIKKVKGKGSE